MREEENYPKQEAVAHSRKLLVVRILRFIMIAAVVVASVIFAVRSVLYITSEQAVINAEIVSLRSPIAGELHTASNIRPGLLLSDTSLVFAVKNPRFGNLESFSQFNYLQNSIDVAKHELQQHLITRQLSLTNYNRMKGLIDQGGVSRQDFETAKNALDSVNAAIARKKSQLKHLEERFFLTQAQLELQKEAVVKAMDGGVIWAVLRKDGEYLNISDEVAQIVRPDDVWVEAFFSERYAPKIRSGMWVTIREFGSKRKWQGSIVFVRSGVGRIAYNAPVAIPPQKLKERLIAVRIKADWGTSFPPEEFYGVGRSVEVTVCR